MTGDHDGDLDVAQAAAQLAALEGDRAALADRLVQPWWWDASLGFLLFAVLGSYSLHNSWVTVGVAVAAAAGLGGLVAAYQRITGTWWDARKVGPVQAQVRRAMRWWLAAYAVLLVLGCLAEYQLDWRGAMVGVGAVLGTACGLLSRWVSRAYVAGLRAGL
ncbi:hypothetical protein [Modestobacter sp. NPDC049651]|uniref:hypothetical protein n=1 Tax=unclassified Modestobacter TaxID=2643866 RepID=UPI0033EAE03B